MAITISTADGGKLFPKEEKSTTNMKKYYDKYDNYLSYISMSIISTFKNFIIYKIWQNILLV